MLFMLIDKGYQLDEVVFYDTGMEFQAIYNTRDAVLPILKKLGIKYTELHPEQPFLWTMFERPVKKRGTNIIHKKGYSWCGGTCRWGTSEKLRALKAHTKDGIDYVGIAADETHRFEKERKKEGREFIDKWCRKFRGIDGRPLNKLGIPVMHEETGRYFHWLPLEKDGVYYVSVGSSILECMPSAKSEQFEIEV